jgi:class 3 adenylate cyclase
VTPLGHRRKLLRAIAELTSGEKDALQPAVASEPPQDTAERRQVTVMFADLVGSTALSARLDPEDLREVIAAYQKCDAETVQRFGGFVAKYMGDGVLVYFGYPQAHEDDAERAVRAGLELVAAVGDLKTHAALQTRVGIATGLVVVGDLIGSGEAQERGIVGETPNLAARLQGIAQPNMVVIADSTRLLGNLFELEDLGARDLKGMAVPVHAWTSLRASGVESRFEALHASGLTELVGRAEELELLLRRWSKAKSGEGQVVLLSGEAGIGKSRLTAALVERLAGEPALTPALLLLAATYRQRTPSNHGTNGASSGTCSRRLKLDELDALLERTSTSAQDAGTTRLTGDLCSPNTVQWTFDNFALANGTGRAVVSTGGDTWFFITADYAFGHDLEAQTTTVVKQMGGKVLGSVRVPLNTPDFSSFLLQAQTSKAKVIGLANAGGDTINSIKQASEFGIVKAGQRMAGLLVFITDVNSLGLDVAQGLQFTEAFYWDMNDDTRAWTKRFVEKINGRLYPTMVHAGNYGGMLHYLKAVEAAWTGDGASSR